MLFVGLLGLLALLCLLSIAIGSRQLGLGTVLRALFDAQDGEVTAIVRGLRLPRTLVGLACGAALGLSGAVMQALTRNPLADPGLLGVSAGAAFAVVAAVSLLGVTSLLGYIWFAFAGALLAGLLVYLIGGLGRGTFTPIRLVLSGVVVTALLSSLTSALALTDPAALNRFRFWSAGSLAGHDNGALLRILPFLAVGVVLAMSSAPALDSLSLGDDVATSLGRRVGLVRLRAAAAVTLLTGSAVAVIGPVAFIGLVVPHLARLISGADHRWLLPLAAVIAPCLLLAADILGRVVARPEEIQTGIVVAFLGAPAFIALVRRGRLGAL